MAGGSRAVGRGAVVGGAGCCADAALTAALARRCTLPQVPGLPLAFHAALRSWPSTACLIVFATAVASLRPMTEHGTRCTVGGDVRCACHAHGIVQRRRHAA